MITVALMFAARYGFFPTEEVPYGRLQPYVAVGPGLFIMNQAVTIQTKSYMAEIDSFSNFFNLSPDSDTSVSLCLVADVGLRWMFSRNFSANVFFRFKHAQPFFTYHYLDPLTLKSASFSMRPTFNILALNFGLAYHF